MSWDYATEEDFKKDQKTREKTTVTTLRAQKLKFYTLWYEYWTT